MGFITDGSTLNWEDAKPHLQYIKQHGIRQFLAIYKKVKDRKNDCLKWGDEIEYIVVRLDREGRVAQVSLRAHEALDELMKEEKENPDGVEVLWRPEYGRYMIEGTPGKPYSGIKDICKVKKNMYLRRKQVQSHLQPDEVAVTMTNFPRLGCENCTYPPLPAGGPISTSIYLPDQIINPHFRFSTLTANIRERRGSRVDINVPLFRDKNTPAFEKLPEPSDSKKEFVDVASETVHHSNGNGNGHYHSNGNGNGHLNGASSPSEESFNIHMDAMGFGMGACCLQCTFQCCNINEARHFYDQLSIISGPLLALTAGTPIFRGKLADIDVRWTVISQSVDDRTPEERGSTKSTPPPVPKSRYDSISTFISPDPSLLPEYNDLNIPIDSESYDLLISEGVDKTLARHFAHLFIRDPLVIYADKIKIDDEQHSDHFENIQSTNWQTVRFKPPPPNSPIGWRVEFRPMEVQLTDFENAAFVAFIVLLTRVISSFDVNLYTPISLVDENMKTAHKRDAVNKEKFYFRKNILNTAPTEKAEVVLMTLNEIINGGGGFPGLIPLINVYLDSTNIDKCSRDVIQQYLSLISKRASGELVTAATWIRNFVTSHPEYKNDSVVSDHIAFDLVNACDQISHGKLEAPSLLGNFNVLG